MSKTLQGQLDDALFRISEKNNEIEKLKGQVRELVLENAEKTYEVSIFRRKLFDYEVKSVEGCEFCNGGINEHGFYGIIVGNLKIEVWKDEHQDVDDEFYLNVINPMYIDDEENLKIYYCPMCGKKLDGE